MRRPSLNSQLVRLVAMALVVGGISLAGINSPHWATPTQAGGHSTVPTKTPINTPTKAPTKTPVPPTSTPTKTPVPPTKTPTKTPTATPKPTKTPKA
jgi:outer membrane biosynthesis protein TonB